MIFEWNDWNRRHIEKPGATPAEAKNVGERTKPTSHAELRTRSSRFGGRPLQVIVVSLTETGESPLPGGF
jgi:hypothetical protein